MIVTCTKCQAKFRIADEKVGPKGVKVRCSKCQNVFPVRRESQEAAPPSTVPPPLPRGAGGGGSLDLDLEAGRAPARAAAFAAQEAFVPAGGAADPFEASSAAAPDPFAATPAPAADPFARDGDPFAAPAAQQDPFSAGAPAAAEPFGPPAPHAGFAPPTTDLSDLLGSGATPAPEAPPAPPPLPDAGAAETAFGSAAGEGLSLEDRTTPRPMPMSSRADLFGSMEPFAGGAPGFGDADLGGPAADDAAASLADAGVAFQFPSSAPVSRPQQAPAPPRPAPRAAVPAPPPPEPEDAAAFAERMRRRRGARLRSIAVNAVSLAVLIVAALALAVMWRRDAPIDARSLRPSALLGALSRRDAPPIATLDVTNGLYERARGAPLLFVRGQVVSHAPAPVHAVRVVVEVVRGEKVLARGEALAGAVPSPEDLWGTEDAASLALLSRSLSARAASPVRPGEQVPFLVALAEYPVDLSGASLRVTASPEGSAAQGAR